MRSLFDARTSPTLCDSCDVAGENCADDTRYADQGEKDAQNLTAMHCTKRRRCDSVLLKSAFVGGLPMLGKLTLNFHTTRLNEKLPFDESDGSNEEDSAMLVL